MSTSALTRLAVLTSLAAIGVAGCSAPATPSLQLASALVPFDACDDALEYLQREGLERVGPYGLDDTALMYGGLRSAVAEDSAANAGGVVPAPAQAGASAGDYSRTNVQEAGVDEPDIVKTNGELIVSVVDGFLRVVDAAGGAEIGRLDVLAGVATDGGPAHPERMAGQLELLLDGDRALVLVRQPMMIFDAPRMMPGWNVWQTSRLVSVDLSDPTQPTQVAALDIDGDLVSARLVDGVARVAVRTYPALEFPLGDDPEAEGDALTERNRAVVEESTIEDWLPSARWSAGEDEEERLLVPCDRLSYPEEFSGFSTVSVLSLPVDGDLREPAGTGVLGSGDTVYASLDRFYVATNGWATAMPIEPGIGDAVTQGIIGAILPAARVAPQQVGTQRTGIHAFDISEPGPARYIGSGEVPGRLIGQYALSEWEGDLRVASTTDAMWGTPSASESRVTVLAERDGALHEVGMVDGLGKGEQIYAVRYAGPTAYVVTFQQTDPLYVLDLADPAAPAVLGELKVTGYSAYLHPVGEDRVVGVGQEARRDGTQIGAQVSLFDVSDSTAPSKLAGHVVRHGWTEAEHDARAFLYWPATRQLVIPMTSDTQSGALVLAVGDDALTEVGVVTAPESSSAATTGETVRRSLVIGDLLFTIWPDGIQSSELASLDPVDWVPFD